MSCTQLAAWFDSGAIDLRFQPIVRIVPESWALHAVECLARGPTGSLFEQADVLFEYVRRKCAEVAVEREILRLVVIHGARVPRGVPLCLNSHAITLARDSKFAPDLIRQCEMAHIPMSDVTVEIVEHGPAAFSQPTFFASLACLREAGVKIALDDVGCGQSNYRMMLEVKPDFFKVDAWFIRGATLDPLRRAVLASISQLAADFGAEVIAEGVETEQDLQTLAALGIRLMQGFLFYRPMPFGDLMQLSLLRAREPVATA